MNNKWQPIETAPKDGTEILAYREDCGVLLIRYGCLVDFETEQDQKKYSEDDLFQRDWFMADFIMGWRLECDLVPTHWMPLPEPPADGE